MFGWFRQIADSVRSIMQVQDLHYGESRQMALNLDKLNASVARLTGVLDNLVTLCANQNTEIASLKAQLARASGATPDEQASVDAVASAVSDKADQLAAAIPAPPPPAPAPAPQPAP